MTFEGTQLALGYKASSVEERLLSLSTEDRRRHLYVIGQTGSGKTTFLKSCLLQDIHNGEGIALIDPHGDLAEDLIDAIPNDRIRHVVYFNPADRAFPIAFNPLGGVKPHLRPLVVSNMIASLRSIWRESWGPRMEHFLANTLATLLASTGSEDKGNFETHPVTLLDVSKMLTDKKFRSSILKRVSDPSLLAFWEHEFETLDKRQRTEVISPILNKIGALNRSPLMRAILGRTKKSFNLSFMMDNQKILIVNLSKGVIGEDMSNLLGSLLVCGLYQTAMARADRLERERRDFHLYIDEFQNFTTDAFDTIVSEARKYRLSLTVAHQYLDQLTPAVKQAMLGNVGTLMLFALSGKDAEELAIEMHPFEASTLRATARGEALALTLYEGVRQTPEPLRIPYGDLKTGSKRSVIRNTRTKYARKVVGLKSY